MYCGAWQVVAVTDSSAILPFRSFAASDSHGLQRTATRLLFAFADTNERRQLIVDNGGIQLLLSYMHDGAVDDAAVVAVLARLAQCPTAAAAIATALPTALYSRVAACTQHDDAGKLGQALAQHAAAWVQAAVLGEGGDDPDMPPTESSSSSMTDAVEHLLTLGTVDVDPQVIHTYQHLALWRILLVVEARTAAGGGLTPADVAGLRQLLAALRGGAAGAMPDSKAGSAAAKGSRASVAGTTTTTTTTMLQRVGAWIPGFGSSKSSSSSGGASGSASASASAATPHDLSGVAATPLARTELAMLLSRLSQLQSPADGAEGVIEASHNQLVATLADTAALWAPKLLHWFQSAAGGSSSSREATVLQLGAMAALGDAAELPGVRESLVAAGVPQQLFAAAVSHIKAAQSRGSDGAVTAAIAAAAAALSLPVITRDTRSTETQPYHFGLTLPRERLEFDFLLEDDTLSPLKRAGMMIQPHALGCLTM